MKILSLNYKKYYLSLATITFLLTGCYFAESSPSSPPSTSSNPLQETQLMMGTVINLSLYDQTDTTLLDDAFELIQTLENTLSLNQNETLLTTVNQNAGVEPTVVTPDMFEIIERGLYYSELTEGSFDITVGPLVKLWNIGFPDARVPDISEIQSTLPLVDYTQLHLDQETLSLYLDTPGMQLDLGSIAKGYATDRVVDLLKDGGVEHALLDLGGNLYVHGTKLDGSNWRVGIQDPFNPRGETIGILEIANKSIVTSGIYERFLDVNGTKYHHILDPSTGYPFDNEIAGVTIVSDSSTDGDALSTSIFSKGIENGLQFVESLADIEAIFISKDKEVYTTSGLKDNFRLTNSEFKLVN